MAPYTNPTRQRGTTWDSPRGRVGLVKEPSRARRVSEKSLAVKHVADDGFQAFLIADVTATSSFSPPVLSNLGNLAPGVTLPSVLQSHEFPGAPCLELLSNHIR